MDHLLDSMAFTDDFAGWRDKLIIEILYHTGIRLSELIHIKDVDIDISKMQMKVLGKRNKERLIPFTQELKKTIITYKQCRELEVDKKVDYFLLTDSGGKVYPKFVYRIVNKHLKSVTTLLKTSPHVLRHTFATHMLNNGADINAIKEILGHANLSATQVYTHNSFKKLKSIYNKAHPRA
jgi:integrase/recombinase XerC